METFFVWGPKIVRGILMKRGDFGALPPPMGICQRRACWSLGGTLQSGSHLCWSDQAPCLTVYTTISSRTRKNRNVFTHMKERSKRAETKRWTKVSRQSS